MTKYESLLNEYEDILDIEEHLMKSDGLYCDSVIWINKNLNQDSKLCILAEELGHYYTTVGDISNQQNMNNAKQESIARAWAIDKLLPFEEFKRAVQSGCYTVPDVADYLNLNEEFVRDSIEHYKLKFGIEFPLQNENLE